MISLRVGMKCFKLEFLESISRPRGRKVCNLGRMDQKDVPTLDGNRVLSTCSKTGPEMRSDKDNSIKLLKTIIEN